jgi:biotin carboxylase
MGQYAIIVDGYHIRAGDRWSFAGAFRSRGVSPVTVLSTPQPIAKYESRWYPDDFEAVHYFDGDYTALEATVRSYDPVCIIPGSEAGVELAGFLADALTPGKGNVAGSALAQRDKGVMVRALERVGVPVLRTISADDPESVARWMAQADLDGRPLVVKPAKAGGADNVYLVGADEDWRPIFSRLLGATNCYGNRNDHVIVQEYADGTEYMVNLYSVGGKHGLVDVCSYIKHNRANRIGIYDAADYLPPDHPDVPMLAEYAMRAAHATGIRNGCTHAEVVLTPDGPRLIELAARPAGSCSMISGSLATGDNQVERTVRHYLDDEFAASFQLVQRVRTTWLCAANAGTVRDAGILRAAQDLPTVRRMSLPANGERIKGTYDASSILGWVIQCASDRADIEADYRRIRELEELWNARQADGEQPGA